MPDGQRRTEHCSFSVLTDFARHLEQVQAELKPLNEISYWVSQVLGPERAEAPDRAEGKRSVLEQLRQARERTQEQNRASREAQKIER